MDHGDLVEISLSPIHQRAAPAARELGLTAKNDLKGPRPIKVGHEEYGDQLGRDTDPTDSDVTRAVTLEPNANDTMTDSAVLLYRDQLADYLAKYRRYPMDARRNHIEGTVYLHFIMSSDGKVLSAWIVQSSGFASLDGEALSAIERAQPLPPIPPGWPRQIDVTIPISFELS
jgi:protein TonB